MDQISTVHTPVNQRASFPGFNAGICVVAAATSISKRPWREAPMHDPCRLLSLVPVHEISNLTSTNPKARGWRIVEALLKVIPACALALFPA